MTKRRPTVDFPRNEAGLVDNFLGSAYDVVKLVHDHLDHIEHVANMLKLLPLTGEEAVKQALAKYINIAKQELDEYMKIIIKLLDKHTEEKKDELEEMLEEIRKVVNELDRIREEIRLIEENVINIEKNVIKLLDDAKDILDMLQQFIDDLKEAENKAHEAIKLIEEAMFRFADVIIERRDFTLDTKHVGKWVEVITEVPTQIIKVTVPEKRHSLGNPGDDLEWQKHTEIFILQSGPGQVVVEPSSIDYVKIETMHNTAPLLYKGGKVGALKLLAPGRWLFYGALEDL